MKALKTTIFLMSTIAIANPALADPFFPGPYLCVHQEISTDSNPIANPVTYIYGEVLNEFEECPVYNENSPFNIVLPDVDHSGVTWKESGASFQTETGTPSFQTSISLFMSGLTFTEDLHERDDKVQDPTCRFGILF